MPELYWPIALIVLSNIFYHVCSKSVPGDVNPLASLTVTYGVGAAASAVLYFALNRGGDLLREYRRLNWSSYVLGLAIVGLEAGFLYLYKAGWDIGTGQLICSSLLAAALLLIGALFYGDALTATKVAGVLICLVGLFFLSR